MLASAWAEDLNPLKKSALAGCRGNSCRVWAVVTVDLLDLLEARRLASRQNP